MDLKDNRYQIAREVIEEYVVIAKTARYLADNRIDDMLWWLAQQQAEKEIDPISLCVSCKDRDCILRSNLINTIIVCRGYKTQQQAEEEE